MSMPEDGGAGIRVVITGKGGVGKTTVAALLAHIFARKGKRVLAVDGDPQQNLAAALGLSPDAAARIVPVAESREYIREKTGAGPGVTPGGFFALNPDVRDVTDRFSVEVAPGLRLLVMGSVNQAGAGCLCPEYALLAAILRHMRLSPDDIVILDTPAGLEHFGRAVADGFSCAVVIADPSFNAVAVARESARLAGELGIPKIIFAVNRVRGDEDVAKVCGSDRCRPAFPTAVFLPYDPEVMAADPAVAGLLDRDSVFGEGVRALAAALLQTGGT
ncbi:AAA family ATPase [Methanoregula sp. UBA64]|jgi:CO dehydrogenase maturation factor|uniref:ATP-binding protein n=1 Tax=Methanoregula sp. UBA64 TaxID=1915554 RepID=UPI0025F81D1F|nr:AAA family ATPase [Methanoregula sp. UBA64]